MRRPTRPPLLVELRRFLGAASDVAYAVRMPSRSGQVAASGNQVFLTNRATLKPTFQDLAHPSRITCLGGQTRSGHMRRHPMVRHGPPGVILWGWLGKPYIACVPG